MSAAILPVMPFSRRCEKKSPASRCVQWSVVVDVPFGNPGTQQCDPDGRADIGVAFSVGAAADWGVDSESVFQFIQHFGAGFERIDANARSDRGQNIFGSDR